MAVKRCVDCGNLQRGYSNGKECPYCEQLLCPSCSDKQLMLFSWNGCTKCCIDYRKLVHGAS
ncbi:hypothetical protein ACFFHM_08490 [Halalkalibacter kiskunsagensis]|uniref:Uncharacterized protein n=1 Tax=Halalkalibacter kiskunsagensis TaxID=1548599 RepID=A0ABV6KC68_9BACI